MLRHTAFAVSLGVVVITLAGGCAGARSLAPDSASASVAAVGDLAGTWHGSLGQVAASLYADEGRLTLNIEDDGTFTATVTPAPGANNRAKRSTLAGTVATRGNRVILRNTQGPWPWVILERSGDNTLYGVATDPATQANVMLRMDRAGTER